MQKVPQASGNSWPALSCTWSQGLAGAWAGGGRGWRGCHRRRPGSCLPEGCAGAAGWSTRLQRIPSLVAGEAGRRAEKRGTWGGGRGKAGRRVRAQRVAGWWGVRGQEERGELERGVGRPRESLLQHRGQRPGPAAPALALGEKRGRLRSGRPSGAAAHPPGDRAGGGRSEALPGQVAAMLLETEQDRDRPGAPSATAVCAFGGTWGKGPGLQPEQEGPEGRDRRGGQRDTWDEGAQQESREGRKV